MEIFLDILDKIIPLLSTLLGALITYFVTTSTKKTEIKLNTKIKARDDYWIPCSKAILDLENKISVSPFLEYECPGIYYFKVFKQIQLL